MPKKYFISLKKHRFVKTALFSFGIFSQYATLTFLRFYYIIYMCIIFALEFCFERNYLIDSKKCFQEEKK